MKDTHRSTKPVAAKRSSAAHPLGAFFPPGCTLVVGGDGRFLVKDTLQKIIQMAHANKVR